MSPTMSGLGLGFELGLGCASLFSRGYPSDIRTESGTLLTTRQFVRLYENQAIPPNVPHHPSITSLMIPVRVILLPGTLRSTTST